MKTARPQGGGCSLRLPSDELDCGLQPRGFRLLSKGPRLPRASSPTSSIASVRSRNHAGNGRRPDESTASAWFARARSRRVCAPRRDIVASIVTTDRSRCGSTCHRARLPSSHARRAVPARPAIGLALAPHHGTAPVVRRPVRSGCRERGWVVCAPEPSSVGRNRQLDERCKRSARSTRAIVGRLVHARGGDRVRAHGGVGFCIGRHVHDEGSGHRSVPAAVAFYGMIRMPDHWRSPTQ